jgi:hypothetical protein
VELHGEGVTLMNEIPKKPGESTLSNAAPPAWEPVGTPSSQPAVPPQFLPPPPAGAYPAAQGYVSPQGYPPPANPAGQGGYRPVYDGGVPPNAEYSAPVYGAQPPNYPPPGYGGQPPYGQAGYPPNNYGQINTAAEMLALAVLMRRRRRWRRHFILWPLLFFVFFTVFVLHGCASFVRGF